MAVHVHTPEVVPGVFQGLGQGGSPRNPEAIEGGMEIGVTGGNVGENSPAIVYRIGGVEPHDAKP